MGKIRSESGYHQSQTGARYTYVPASTGKTITTSGASLLRVILLTNGGVVTIKTTKGEVIGNIALDAPEQSFPFGIYLQDGIRVETGATCEVLVAWEK